MKKSVLLAISLFNASAALAADTVSWARWSGTIATLVQDGNNIVVSYAGQWNSTDHIAAVFDDVPTSFTNSAVTNTPGANGTIHMTGGTSDKHNFHFSKAVMDPLIAIWSVGQRDVAVTFNFDSPFTILRQGAGHWGGGSLEQNGNSLTGLEGNGLLQLHGSYTDISFTTPNVENFYGLTVGAMISAIPEPESYAMLLAGLGLMGLMVRRRKHKQTD
jgi:hypothetical protein